MDSMEGKVAIVTGGGNGVGRGVALLLGELGAKVIVNDYATNKDTGKKSADMVVEEIVAAGGTAIPSYDDLNDMGTGPKLVQMAIDHYGKVDILCLVAGMMLLKDVDQISGEEWDRVMNVNANSMFSIVKAAVPYMKEQKSGRIVLFASRAAFGNGHSAVYSASKAAVMGLAGELGYELTPLGINTNCVLPSAVTGLFPKSKVAYDGTPKPAPEGPDMIAPMTVYLCSDECEVSGEYFYISGCDVGLYPRNRLPVGLIRKGNETKWTVDELVKMIPETFDWYFSTKQKSSSR